MYPLTKASNGKIRLQVELTPSQEIVLQRMMESCGIETRKELVNTALTLFQWAIDERRKGNEIASINNRENKHVVLHISALERASYASKDRVESITPPNRAASQGRHAKLLSGE